MHIGDGIDRLRNPAYTGANRCVPCTVVNACIGVATAVVVAALLARAVGRVAGASAGVAVAFVAGASIYLRGYLVPGTPHLTKTYFPDWLLRRFDKGVAATAATEADGDFTVETALTSAGVVEACEDADDLCLTDDFRAAWDGQLASASDDDASHERLARLLGVDTDRLALEEHGTAFVARADGVRAGQWESRAAFLADVAAGDALAEWMDGWAALDIRRRSQLLYGLRIFLERCPACDGTVVTEADTVESCCRSLDVVAVSCRDCGARLFEMERPEEGTVR